METVAAAIIKQNGRFLIARRKAGGVVGGKWEFPGGKIENGESHEEGLRREIREELGVDVIVKEFFDKHVCRYKTGVMKIFAYIVECSEKNFRLIEHDEVRWISNKEMENFEFVGNDRLIIRKLSCKC